jgi:DNA-binding FrmR family transcriptional regulator
MPSVDHQDHLHPPAERRALQIRLRKIGGQLRAIENMLEEDRDCSEVLTQLISARRALKSLSERLISMHMHSCIEQAESPVQAKHKLRDLLVVLQRYVE